MECDFKGVCKNDFTLEESEINLGRWIFSELTMID